MKERMSEVENVKGWVKGSKENNFNTNITQTNPFCVILRRSAKNADIIMKEIIPPDSNTPLIYSNHLMMA